METFDFQDLRSWPQDATVYLDLYFKKYQNFLAYKAQISEITAEIEKVAFAWALIWFWIIL